MINKLLPLLVFLALCTPVLAEDTVCLQCHGGQEGRLGAPVGLWKTSVHAANGISCHDCHGGDPTDFGTAMDPDKGFLGAPDYADVPAFCGRCHLGVREDYSGSAHGKALGKGGPQCVVCHGNHAVQKASIELINKESCTRCHSYERAAKVKTAISQTEDSLKMLEGQIDELHRVGIDTKKISGQLFSSRNDFRRLFHTVDVEEMRAETAGFTTRLDKIGAQITVIKDELSQRKMVGGLVVLLLIVGGCIAMLIRKSYHEEE
ncbi:MAG: cytochrome c3 family protein [Geopsychrobacter sp.]|nr:cytochrome c3 family protein [Geopsychrobacter sp.]